MDPYSFLRALDSRDPFQCSFNGLLNGLNPLTTLSGLGPSMKTDLIPGLAPPSADAPVDVRGKGRIAREEAALEAKIVQKIALGNVETLKPNSGKAVSIGEHQICVAFHDDKDSGYRIWEWHGHLLMFDDEEGYTPQYIYGNHFQPLEKASDQDEALKVAIKIVNGGAGVASSRGLGSIIGAFDIKLGEDESPPSTNRLLRNNILHRNNGKKDLALASSSMLLVKK